MAGRKKLGPDKKRFIRLNVRVTKREYELLKISAKQFEDTRTARGKPIVASYLRKFALKGIDVARYESRERKKRAIQKEEREKREREIELAILRGKPIPEEYKPDE